MFYHLEIPVFGQFHEGNTPFFSFSFIGKSAGKAILLLQYYQVLGSYIKLIGSKEHPFLQKPCSELVELLSVRNSVIKIYDDKPVGYCISSCITDNGGVDSIYISPELRDLNMGRKPIKRSLHWLQNVKGCTRILLAVSYGNESVTGFYEKLCF